MDRSVGDERLGAEPTGELGSPLGSEFAEGEFPVRNFASSSERIASAMLAASWFLGAGDADPGAGTIGCRSDGELVTVA